MSNNQPKGYIALPASGKGDPVLVLHAWWGLNDTIKALCNRLAEAGYVAFAPDLYHGKVTDQIDEAETFAGEIFDNLAAARAEAANAVTYLSEYHGTRDSIAVIGFSLGAFFALDLSANMPEKIRSVVAFYGTGPDDFSRSKAAYLGHFAENDPFEPQSNVDGLQEVLKNAGRPVAFYTYEGTGHWFFEPDREDAYHKDAADLAWGRTLDFLKSTFAG